MTMAARPKAICGRWFTQSTASCPHPLSCAQSLDEIPLELMDGQGRRRPGRAQIRLRRAETWACLDRNYEPDSWLAGPAGAPGYR
jgi:hypothetical protein